jgi:predicted nucleic acid-binding protein
MEPAGKYLEYIRTLQSICLQVLGFSEEDMRDAVRMISLYGLMPADAAHIAVISRRGIRHLATGEQDFTVVEDITV